MIKYERIITDDEQRVLEHDLLDIIDWIDKAIEGKINQCAKRAALQYKSEAVKLGLKSIPVDNIDCALNLFEVPTYQNRMERESINGTGDIKG